MIKKILQAIVVITTIIAFSNITPSFADVPTTTPSTTPKEKTYTTTETLKERINHGFDIMLSTGYMSNGYTSKRPQANNWATGVMNKLSNRLGNDFNNQAFKDIISNGTQTTSAVPYGVWLSSSHVLWNRIYANLQANFLYASQSTKHYADFNTIYPENTKQSKPRHKQFVLNASGSMGYFFWINPKFGIVPYGQIGFHGRVSSTSAMNGTETNIGPFVKLEWLTGDKWLVAPYVGVMTMLSEEYEGGYVKYLGGEKPTSAYSLHAGMETRYLLSDRVSLLLHIKYELRAVNYPNPVLLTESDIPKYANSSYVPLDKVGDPRYPDEYQTYYSKAYDSIMMLGIGVGFHF